MFKKMLLIPLATLSLTLSQPLLADATKTVSDNMASCSCMKNMQKMADSLSLDSEQKNKIKAIKSQLKEQMLQHREEMKLIRAQIDALVQSDKVDEAKLDALIAQKSVVMNKAMKERTLAKHEMFVILSPEQKEKFRAMEMKKMDSKAQCGMM